MEELLRWMEYIEDIRQIMIIEELNLQKIFQTLVICYGVFFHANIFFGRLLNITQKSDLHLLQCHWYFLFCPNTPNIAVLTAFAVAVILVVL